MAEGSVVSDRGSGQRGKQPKNKPTPLYQKKPVFKKPSQFRAKGWTETVEGYQAEARQLSRCIVDNRRLMGTSYSWLVTINVEVVQTARQITDLWAAVCRNLRRKGIVALWVREPTRSGKVHYHVLVRDDIAETDLRRIVRESMPDLGKPTPGGRRQGWHMKPQRVEHDWRLALYMTKAKVAGVVKGKEVDDYYEGKRLLFSTNLKIKKYGTIGDFWMKPKKALWQAVRDKEQRIAEGLKNPDVRRLAELVHEFIGGSIPLKDIERNYGYYADDPVIQDWIRRRFYPQDGDDPEDGGMPFGTM